MAKVITQETFDETVKENIEVFSMETQEAKEETIKQFEAQGINLDNIIKDLNTNEESGVPILVEAIDNIKANTEIKKSLKTLKTECGQSIPHRVLASKLGGHDLIFGLMENTDDEEVLILCLQAQISMTDKNPDIFQLRYLPLVKKLLVSKSIEIVCLCLKWFQKACILHEQNRQMIMNEEFLEDLKLLIKRDEPKIIKETSTVLRYLVLDDDVRVEFGKAHEHARTISTEMLEDITKLLMKFKHDEELVCDLMVTIASITVRNEFCVLVEKSGGLEFTLGAMKEFPETMKINREALKLLKALAGNDTVKIQIIKCGAAPIIENCLDRFKSNENFAKVALACISTLTLRVKENSQALFESGISETIIETMKIHQMNEFIQRNGAWAIRNMVSRSREQCDTFIAAGAADVLNDAMKNHPRIVTDLKSALRDLGCKVHLVEEWTGVSEIKIAQ